MKLDLEKWRNYYDTSHQLNRSKDVQERLYIDIILKECSSYLDECGLKMRFVHNPHAIARDNVKRGAL